MIKKQKLINLALVLIILAFISAISFGAVEDFEIKDGVLIEYKGKDETVKIPNGVTSIGNNAFKECTFIKSITMPDSVTNIGDNIFGSCQGLTSINVNENNPSYSSLNGVLLNKDKTELIRYPRGKPEKSYNIPDSVTSIGFGAFFYCESLISMVISDGVTRIKMNAFSYCTSLTSVVIPNSVKSIEGHAFFQCKSLKSITIPDSVTSIGKGAFEIIDFIIPYNVIIIHGTAGSYAEKYAKENNIEFQAQY